jgi:NAD(P)-dependent dehydrogenase (short-subunit alcohol dehydrogenase family)
MGTYIVTGAAGGIGSKVCERLCADGHHVVCADRASEALDELVQRLGNASAMVVDLSVPDECTQLVADAVAEHGALDGAVTCAGIMLTFDPSSHTTENFDLIMRINVLASYLVADAVGRSIADREGNGSIVLFSSGAAGLAFGVPFYSASKGAVESTTRELSRRWAPHGVRVNAVSPGATDTPMLAEARKDPERFERLVRGIDMRRPGDPRETAAVVAFLLGAESSFVTGQIVRVDGGRTSAV